MYAHLHGALCDPDAMAGLRDNFTSTPGTAAISRDLSGGPGQNFVLTLWTDDPVRARHADAAGVDRVGLDLETRGKRERQAGLGTWISPHGIESLPDLRRALTRARLFARVNPIGGGSRAEVERLLGLGVEVLMLPMFHEAAEVARFLEIVSGRARVVALLETRDAAEDIARIARLRGLREVHIGINDLALSVGARNRFEVLDSELMEHVSAHVRDAGLRFGIGGIGRVDDTDLPIPSDLIYAQYARLGATAALISRRFVPPGTTSAELAREIGRSRERLSWWCAAGDAELQEARRALRLAIRRYPRW